MTSPEQQAALDRLKASIEDCLAYFQGDGLTNAARVGDWGAWEVLAHFYYWHYATAWGIASASAGGAPWLVATSDLDGVNLPAVEILRGASMGDLVGDLRRLNDRLLRAVAGAPDWDATVFRRPDGSTMSIRRRIEIITNHWRDHVDELKRVAGQ